VEAPRLCETSVASGQISPPRLLSSPTPPQHGATVVANALLLAQRCDADALGRQCQATQCTQADGTAAPPPGRTQTSSRARYSCSRRCWPRRHGPPPVTRPERLALPAQLRPPRSASFSTLSSLGRASRDSSGRNVRPCNTSVPSMARRFDRQTPTNHGGMGTIFRHAESNIGEDAPRKGGTVTLTFGARTILRHYGAGRATPPGL
jgi:hypothetical protein